MRIVSFSDAAISELLQGINQSFLFFSEEPIDMLYTIIFIYIFLFPFFIYAYEKCIKKPFDYMEAYFLIKESDTTILYFRP